MGSQHLLVLLGSASDDHTNLAQQSTYELVEPLREMLPEPDRNLVEPIEDEVVPIRADERASDCTLVNFVAYRGAQVVNEKGFEGILGFPRREVDQKWYSSLTAFSVIEVLDEGVGRYGLARARLTDDEQASL